MAAVKAAKRNELAEKIGDLSTLEDERFPPLRAVFGRRNSSPAVVVTRLDFTQVVPAKGPDTGPARVAYRDGDEETDDSDATELSEDYEEDESDSSADDDIPPMLKVRPASAMARASNAYEPIARGPIAARPPSAMARLHPPPPIPTPPPSPDPTPPSTPLATPPPDLWEQHGYEAPEAMWDDLTDEQLKMLQLISLYSHKAQHADEKETWMRQPPFLCIIFEGIVAGVMDMDYAPQPMLVDSKRCYMNVSQDGKDDLDDLREAKLVASIKLTTKTQMTIAAYQLSAAGHAFMCDGGGSEELQKRIGEAREMVDTFTRDEDGNLLLAEWDDDEQQFHIVNHDYSYDRISKVTDTEDVSYVCSPYLPKVLLAEPDRELRSNAHRSNESSQGKSEIADALNEVLSLNDVVVVISEWLPMGLNMMRELNDRMGSAERVQGGMFSAEVDSSVDLCSFEMAPGTTEVLIIDYDLSHFVNIDAEINFPEEEGVIQVESFGVHMNADGMVCFGLRIDAVLERVKNQISFDNLSRVLVDIQQDSSQLLGPCLSQYQRSLLNMRYFENSACREKCTVIFAEGINPHGDSNFYMDKEEKENELKQVIGETHQHQQLSTEGDGELVILGSTGILLVGPNSLRHETVVIYYMSLQIRQTCISNLHTRMQYLTAQLNEIASLIDAFEKHPKRVDAIRDRLSACSKCCMLMKDTLIFLDESLVDIVQPELDEMDEAAKSLFYFLDIESIKPTVQDRIEDLQKNVKGAEARMGGLRDLVKIIREHQAFKGRTAMQESTKNLQQILGVTERSARAAEVMQTLLCGTLAFNILDRLSGYWDVLGNTMTDVTWGQSFFQDTLMNEIGRWFGVSMLFWFLMSWFLLRLMRRMSDDVKRFIEVNTKVAVPVDIRQLERYLRIKGIDEHNEIVEVDDKRRERKVCWDEDSGYIWKGAPPHVEMFVDMRHGFISRIVINYDKAKGKLHEDDLVHVLLDEMDMTDVILKDEEKNEGAWKLEDKVLKNWDYSADVADEEEEEELEVLREQGYTDDQLRFLYLIALYSHQAETSGDTEKWIRHMSLMVMAFEGILAEAFNYDYAPVSCLMGTKRVFLNISQDAQDDLDDLRELKCVNSIKLTTKDFCPITAYQCSEKGLSVLESVPGALRHSVDEYVFDADGELVEAFWNESEFIIRSTHGEYDSAIMDTEDVSYVSSAYLPESLRQGGIPTSSNARRAKESAAGVLNLKDELEEYILLDEVSLLISEWIPMGANTMMKLNDSMGSTARVQGGMFAQEGEDSDSTSGEQQAGGQSEMKVLDYREVQFINIEATIKFPEDEGIVQIESFGIHASWEGTLFYGLNIDAIQERIRDRMSLDYLARLIVDVQQDSSRIVQPVLTPYQVTLMRLMFGGDSCMCRDKYNAIFAERIRPKVKGEEYFDKEERENELKQIVGNTDDFADLSENEVFLRGQHGLIISGPNCRRLEPQVLTYTSLRSRDLFLRNFHIRMNAISHQLSQVQHKVNTVTAHPNRIIEINTQMAQVDLDVTTMEVALQYMKESLVLLTVPPPPSDDPGGQMLNQLLDFDTYIDDLNDRIVDAMKNCKGIVHELTGLRGNMQAITENNQMAIAEAMFLNTKSMEKMHQSSSKSAIALEVMVVLVSAATTFAGIDRMSGAWSVVGVDDWAEESVYDAYVAQPFLWFGFSLVMWAICGTVVVKVLAYQAVTQEFIRIHMDCKMKVDMKQLALYLHVVEIEDEEFFFEEGQHTWRKVTWTETNMLKWEGFPPKVDVVVDWTYGWVLRCTIEYDKSQGKMNRMEIKRTFFEELMEAQVIENDVDLDYLIHAHDHNADEKRQGAFEPMFGDENYVETPRYRKSRDSAFESRGSSRNSSRDSSGGSRGSSRDSRRGSRAN